MNPRGSIRAPFLTIYRAMPEPLRPAVLVCLVALTPGAIIGFCWLLHDLLT